jgi:hypothetical protein
MLKLLFHTKIWILSVMDLEIIISVYEASGVDYEDS